MTMRDFALTAAAAGLILLPQAVQAGVHIPGYGYPPSYDCPPSPAYTVGQAVNTTSGLVHGHSAPNATEVSEYLGIPFAEPPIGNLRFAPPVRYYGSGELSGEATGKICPQLGSLGSSAIDGSAAEGLPAFLLSLGGLNQKRDEDCLTINVWTKPQTSSAKKPVMVWIYGGGFATGSSNATAYSGQYFADEQDVVFVNFNYRLGIFGFPGAPGLTQNVGLLDQRMAVEWVRDNAEAFGGDRKWSKRLPSRGSVTQTLTVIQHLGLSSLVNLLAQLVLITIRKCFCSDILRVRNHLHDGSYAWTDDPIIAGTITESGQVNSFGNKAAAQQASRWYQVSTELGCGNDTTSTPEQVVECMRDPVKVDSAALTNVSTGTGALSVILAQFGPTIDEKTVFSNYTQRIIDGDFIKTPTLTGSNDNEAGIFIPIFALFGIQQSQSAWDFLTESVFTCPANSAGYARWLHNVPVWRYRYFPSFPNIQISSSIGRAYHLSEVFPLFNTDQDISGQESTETERAIGKYLRDAWSDFAHDPAGALGGSKYNWPQYSPNLNTTQGLVLLGKDNHTTADFSARGDYDGPACTDFYQGLVGF